MQGYVPANKAVKKIVKGIASISLSVIAIILAYFITKEDYAVEVDIGFQIGNNGEDLTSTMVIRNSGNVPLKNLRGEIRATNAYNGSSPYFKPIPWMEPHFRWEDNTGLLTFNWPMMNPGEVVNIPAIYHSKPVYEWNFWIKADGVTFTDTVKCDDCENEHKTFSLSDASM